MKEKEYTDRLREAYKSFESKKQLKIVLQNDHSFKPLFYESSILQIYNQDDIDVDQLCLKMGERFLTSIPKIYRIMIRSYLVLATCAFNYAQKNGHLNLCTLVEKI